VRDQEPFIEVVGRGAAEVPYDRVRLRLEALRRNGAEQLQSSDIEIYPDRDEEVGADDEPSYSVPLAAASARRRR